MCVTRPQWVSGFASDHRVALVVYRNLYPTRPVSDPHFCLRRWRAALGPLMLTVPIHTVFNMLNLCLDTDLASTCQVTIYTNVHLLVIKYNRPTLNTKFYPSFLFSLKKTEHGGCLFITNQSSGLDCCTLLQAGGWQDGWASGQAAGILWNAYLSNCWTDFLHSEFYGIVLTWSCAMPWPFAHLSHIWVCPWDKNMDGYTPFNVLWNLLNL